MAKRETGLDDAPWAHLESAHRAAMQRAQTVVTAAGDLRVQIAARVQEMQAAQRQLAGTVFALRETSKMERHGETIGTNGDGRLRVRLRGEIDFQSAQVVREAIHSAAPEGDDPLVLDLTDLKYIDSSGISALVSAARQARARGGRLRLEGVSPHVRFLLSVTGFTRLFQVTDGELIPARFPGATREAKVWQHLCFTIPARTCLVKHIRLRVSEMLESLSPDGTLLDAVNLAVGEAASNAVRHGCREDERKKVRVQSATDGHTLVVEISDPGPGFDLDQIPNPELGELREGGMGIYFMRLTMDEVTYSFDEGTKVRLVKHLTV
jgi:anti-anti-sigma factor